MQSKLFVGSYYQRKIFSWRQLWCAKKKTGCSWAWGSILEGRDLLLTHSLWQVGDGTNIRISKDRWLDTTSPLTSQIINDQNATVSTILNQHRRTWDIRKIFNSFPRNQAAKIVDTTLLPEGEKDRLIWPFTKNGSYEVKSGYHGEKNRRNNLDCNACSSSSSVDSNFWKQIWNAKISPKIKTFIWKACRNAISTKQNLFRRKLTDSSLCPIYHEATEDIEHLLLYCPWTKPIWFGSHFQWSMENQEAARLDLWLQDKFALLATNKENQDQNIALLLTLCWYIWKGRNLKLFENKDPLPMHTLTLAINSASETYNQIKNPSPSVTPSLQVNPPIRIWHGLHLLKDSSNVM